MKKAILYTLMFVLLQLAVQFLVTVAWMLLDAAGVEGDSWGMRFSATGMQPVTLVVATGVFNLLTAVLFVSLRWTPVSASFVRQRRWDVVLWCVMASLGSLVPSMWFQEQLPELPDTVSATMHQMMHVPGCFFVIAVLAPVCEELVFRGAVLRALLRWLNPQRVCCDSAAVKDGSAVYVGLTRSQWAAVGLSAVFFALVHGNPAQMPHAFMIGVLMGWLFARTGSVVPGLVLHVTNNTLAYLLTAAYPSAGVRLIDILGGQQRSVVMALCFSLMVLLPALYQLHLRCRR
ncbi:MAG: CPBP family intramembrane metalloprotease [Prevotella sp.]|nr:CPBP family intramembrane metalloprotease [Prevotella sp.]